MRIKMFISGMLFIFVISLVVVSSTFSEESSFNVGYKIYDFEYVDEDGDAQTLTTALWYPTDKQPSLYTYPDGSTSKIAVDAPIAQKEKPYPFVLFIHAYFGSGIGTAYFTEFLASHGYIVAGPDYIDTMPPDFKEQAAIARIKEGNIILPITGVKLGSQFVDIMDADREKCLWYISKSRISPSSFIIDKILELNGNSDSFFYQTIDENAIGILGYSLGGASELGLIGGYPDKKDERIKTALLFSPATYPFEDNIQNIDIPIMVMVGDDDPPNLKGPNNAPRTLAYDRANPPKYLLVMKNAGHLSFGSGNCLKGVSDTTLFDCRQSNPQSQAICKYGLAFFDRYLKNNISAEEELNKSDPAWAEYKKEVIPEIVVPELHFKTHLYEGLNMISVPLDPGKDWRLSDLADYIGKDNVTVIIWYNTETEKFTAYLPASSPVDSPVNPFINGDQGYIINVLQPIDVIFTGSGWSNMSPRISTTSNNGVWAFAVAGVLYDEDGIRKTKSSVSEANTPVTESYSVTIKNLNTGSSLYSSSVGWAGDGMFVCAFVDLNRNSVVNLGDTIELVVQNAAGKVVAGSIKHYVQNIDLKRASVVLNIRISDIVPEKNDLLQNFPNPFNPETWLPYQLAERANVKINIYDAFGHLVRVIDLGYKEAGMYISKDKAAYWNGKNEASWQVASGIYFYTIEAKDFTATRKMLMVK